MKKPIKKSNVVKAISNYTGRMTTVGGVVMPLRDALEYDRK